MLHAFGSDQHVGQLLHAPGITFQNEDFKAAIVIEMGMRGADNQIVMIMLQVHQFFRKKSGMVVVNQGHCTDNRRLRVVNNGRDETIAD